MQACVSQHMDGDQRLHCRNQFSSLSCGFQVIRLGGKPPSPTEPISMAPKWLILSPNIYLKALKLQQRL